MASTTWDRLIRFTADDQPEVLFGEPVASDYTDIGRLADEGKLQAKVIEYGKEGPLSHSARVTDKVVSVTKLLGPLDLETCTDIKCIGLNYKKHSTLVLIALPLGERLSSFGNSSRRR